MKIKQKAEEPSFGPTIREIEAQKNDIPEYISYLHSLKLESVNPDEAVFCGAGDSLAAAKFVERLMNFKTRSFDPYDVVLYPEVARDKKVFFISVSGKTAANIQAARSVIGRARETIAITANPQSELARLCSDAIRLQFTKEPQLTPGTNSFTASLIACASIFKNPPKFNIQKMLAHARAWGRKAVNELSGATHFVGSGSFYAIALYGAAKVFEFSGRRSDYQLTEEFSHLNLFSLKENDSVVLLSYGPGDQKAQDLNTNLIKAGIKTLVLPTPKDEKEHVLQRAISYSIHLQYLALNAAKIQGLNGPAFLKNKELLQISNNMIY